MPNDEIAAATRPATVSLPAALVNLFPGADRRLDVHASTVRDVIEALEARWPGMWDRLCDSTPKVRRHISIVVEGRRASLETPLAPGAVVFILTAISGG